MTGRTRGPIPVAKPWLPPVEEYIEAIRDIFTRRQISNLGTYASLLEERARAALGCDVLCVSSCDIGLTLAWRALGLREGEVIVPSFTFASTVNAVVWNGLTPVFADIDPATLCIDPDHARSLVGPRTVAVTGVHVFGEPVDPALDALAARTGLALVFDAAHAAGTSVDRVPVARRGDISVLSLSGTKVVTSGEGGLAMVADPTVRHRYAELRGYGHRGDYNIKATGLNGKMSELETALGYLSFGHLDALVTRRMDIAAIYRARLEQPGLVCMQPAPGPDDTRSYKDVFVLFSSGVQRAVVQDRLTANDIGTKRYFRPVHQTDAYRHLGRDVLPNTQAAWDRGLCLPIFHDLEDEDVHWICDVIEEALADITSTGP